VSFALGITLVVTVVLSIPAWYFAQTRDVWFGWDYATLIVPAAIWLALTTAGIGHQSLSHVLELAALTILIPLALSVRVFALDRWLAEPLHGSVGTFAVCSLAAVGLRLFTPHMAE